MDVPLSPLEFARRSRRLYAEREALVDGDLRLTYAQLFDRCDRWSNALQGMGVGGGDRVAYMQGTWLNSACANCGGSIIRSRVRPRNPYPRSPERFYEGIHAVPVRLGLERRDDHA